jgi:Fe-S-cluster formation regulator IscX/YfhJ
MSLEEAKELLDFPLHANPTPAEVRKRLRTKAIEHHPDLGGDPRKMVELSVAADILQGKRVRDRTKVSPSPQEEEARKRRESARRVNTLMDKAVLGMEHVQKAYIVGLRLPGKMDLREYLADDFVDELGDLQDAADKALKGSLAPKDERVWKDARKVAHDLVGRSSRLASRYKLLLKSVKRFQEEPKLADFKTLMQRGETFREMFLEFRMVASRLSGLLGTTETVPFKTYDSYFDKFATIDAFAKDLKQLNLDAQKPGEKILEAIEAAIDEVSEYKIKTPKPEQWIIPDDFDKLISTLNGYKSASSVMVVAKFVRTL